MFTDKQVRSAGRFEKKRPTHFGPAFCLSLFAEHSCLRGVCLN